MDNYEVNILRRDGNWKKINPNDFLLGTVDKNELKKNHNTTSKIETDKENQDDFLYYLNEVNIITDKLENLENEKTDLKNQLKIFMDKFQSKKTNTDKKIKIMSKEAEILDKTIRIIKNLKNF